MSSRTPQNLAYAVLGLIGVGSYFMFGSHHPQPSFEPGHMPACNSGFVRQLLKETIEEPSPSGEVFQVQKIGGIDDASNAFTPEEIHARPDRRRCVATVFTNAGRQLVVFQIDWSDNAKNEVYLEIPQLPF